MAAFLAPLLGMLGAGGAAGAAGAAGGAGAATGALGGAAGGGIFGGAGTSGLQGMISRMPAANAIPEGATSAEPTMLDKFTQSSKDFLGKTGEGLMSAGEDIGTGIGNVISEGPSEVTSRFKDIFNNPENTKGTGGTGLEALSQSGVADLTDAAGIFGGQSPKHRRFASPTIIQEQERVAELIEKLNKQGDDMKGRIRSSLSEGSLGR